MVNRVLMWTTAGPRLQQRVTENPITRRAAHRFLAGEVVTDLRAAIDYRYPHMEGWCRPRLGARR
jgi:hypothetical protein